LINVELNGVGELFDDHLRRYVGKLSGGRK
jgi:hypothetical protein